uniref:Large ribosomal subunit protein mL52 n=1 Tax=Pundamilia nyererei TaxID=303518 RepID=A0A3B4FIZ0_9CICH
QQADVRSITCASVGAQNFILKELASSIRKLQVQYGPLTDLPDWSFADGRPAPPMKGQLRRRQEREALSRRIVMLNSEVDRGMEAWREKQEEAKRMEEHKKSLLLKPKGKLLMKKKSQS